MTKPPLFYFHHKLTKGKVFQDMSCFGLGIRLTKEEKAKLSEVVNLAHYATALINDYHSWPKELKHRLMLSLS